MAFGPAGCSPWHQVEEYHRLAEGNAVVDYGFHGVLQHVDGAALDDMADIARREGITSFKAYMTYDHRLDDLALMRVTGAGGARGHTDRRPLRKPRHRHRPAGALCRRGEDPGEVAPRQPAPGGRG